MKKILFLFIATLLFSSLAHSQQKLLTIDDIFDPMKRVRFSGQPTFVEWASDGVSFKDFSKGILMRTNALSGQSQPFYDAKELVSALSQVPGFTIEEANNLGQSPEQHFNSTETAISSILRMIFLSTMLPMEKLLVLTNTDAAEELEEDFSPDGKTISFVRGWNLFVVDVATAKETQLTFDGTEKILNGYLPWVYEEELYGRGNKRGYWWSPDSTKISYLRTDSTPVKPFIVINHEGVNQEVETEWYPKAGQPNPSVKLGILNISEATKVSQVPGKDGITKFVDLSNYNADDVLIARVTWSPDSQSVIFQALNREQTFLDLNAANRETGSVTKILTEKNARLC